MGRKRLYGDVVCRRTVSLSQSLDEAMTKLRGVNWSSLDSAAWQAECRRRSREFDAACVAIEQEAEARKRVVFAEIVASGVV